jgi:hypothetical protein
MPSMRPRLRRLMTHRSNSASAGEVEVHSTHPAILRASAADAGRSPLAWRELGQGHPGQSAQIASMALRTNLAVGDAQAIADDRDETDDALKEFLNRVLNDRARSAGGSSIQYLYQGNVRPAELEYSNVTVNCKPL